MELFSQIRVIYRLLSPQRRLHLYATLVLMLLGIVAEAVGIGTVMLFLTFAADLETSYVNHDLMRWIVWVYPDPFMVAAIALALAIALSTIVRVALAWVNQEFVIRFGAELSVNAFRRITRQSYAVHTRESSSEILNGLGKVDAVVSGFVEPLMQGLIATITAMCIGALLFSISPFAAATTFVVVLGAYTVASKFAFARMRRNSEIMAVSQVEKTKILQESVGGIRDIILERSQGVFEERFVESDLLVRRATGANLVISTVPKYIIQAVGMFAIIVVCIVWSRQPGGFDASIPVLGALSYGALRLLPFVQNAWSGLSNAIGNTRHVYDVMRYIHLAETETDIREQPLIWEDKLSLNDVSFRYDPHRPTLHNVSLTINRGEHIGISGKTGSGKSTLLDLMLGLLPPFSGDILVDGNPLTGVTRLRWQSALAHVPQAIFLIDDSIARNIAFGLRSHEIDMDRLRNAARIAQIDSFIAEQPKGYDTAVGERGIRLSGGQRQRLGIARALYKQSMVLILDEATSALDSATEGAIMREISSLTPSVTVITVAHRESTLAYCDRVLHVENGMITERKVERDIAPASP